MKALKLRISDDLYARFKRLHPAYGEESQKFREILEAYVSREERRTKVYEIHEPRCECVICELRYEARKV